MLLSRTVILKLSVLATDGKTSQVGVVLLIMAAKFGNVLEDEVVGAKDLKFGLPGFVAIGGITPVISLFICSQV